MRGYPKGSLSKQDYENLLAIPEHAEQAKSDLVKLAAIDDSKIITDEGTAESPKLKEIGNPLPAWKRAGFASKEGLIAVAEAAIKADISTIPTI